MSQTKAQLISDLVQALNFTGTASAPANGAFLSAANTLALATNSGQRLTIDSDGRVAIGHNQPSSFSSAANRLVVSTSSGNCGISINATATNANSSLFFTDGTGSGENGAGRVSYEHQNNAMAFTTDSNESMRIDSSQRLLIGTTTARVESNGFAAPLQVEGTGTATSSVIIARNSNNASSSNLIFQKSRGTSTGSNTVIQNNDAVGTIIFEGSDGTNTDSLASIIGACDGTPGTNDVPGRLVFSTTADGAASPTERLRINSDGDVSISSDGTVHGASKLTILPANRTTAFSASDGDTWHDIVLKQTGDATANSVGIAFVVGSSAYHKNAGTGICAVKNGTASDYGSDLVFITRPQSAAAEERLRILSDGKVGISESTPDAKLEIKSADSTYALKLTCSENVSGSYNGLSIAGADENSGSYPLVVVSNSTTHETGGHPILCCNQRKVGIGTLTPTAYLDVESNAASGYVAEFRQINTSNSAQILIDSPTDADSRPALIDLARAGTVKWSIGQGYNATGGHLYFATSSLSSGVTDAKVVIETGGFVGIGTTNPNENLMVVDTHANQPKIRIETSDGGNKRLDLFVDSNSVATISAQQSAQNINIKSRNQTIFTQGSTAAEVESMRIDSDGRLLVGTTASLGVLGLAAQLQIAGDTAGESSLALRRFGDSAQGAFLTFSKSRNAADNSRTIAVSGDELGRIAFCMDDGNDLAHAGAEIRANVDGTPGQDDTPGRITFLTTQDGANGLTERFRINNIGNLHWRNNNVKQRKIYFFLSQSGDTQLDTKLSENFSNNDMLRVDYAYNWNAGDGGAWGTAVVWKQYEGTLRYRLLGEETASPAEFVAFYISGDDVFIRFDLVATSGMNGYAMLNVETGGCDPRAF